jgi:hypothetical protein
MPQRWRSREVVSGVGEILETLGDLADDADDEALAARVAEEEAERTDIGADDVYTFHGFLATDAVEQPGVAGKWWQPLFLDLQRRHVLYLEDAGILGNDLVEDERAPGKRRDMLWVMPNTTVGVARMAQSIEGQFLSGQFTRAADFRDSPAGGTIAAATGVFCEGDSIGCCRPTKR